MTQLVDSRRRRTARRPAVTSGGWAVAGVVAAALGGAAVASAPALGLAALMLVVAALVVHRWGVAWSSVTFLLVALFAPLPGVVPMGVDVGPGTLLWADLAALAVLFVAVASGRGERLPALLGPLGVVVTLLLVVALVRGLLDSSSVNDWVRDARLVLYFGAGSLGLTRLLLAGRIALVPLVRIVVVLVVLAALARLAVSVTGQQDLFHGRYDDGALYVAGQAISGGGGTRILMRGTDLSVAVLAGVLADRLCRDRPVVPLRWALLAGGASALTLVLTQQRTVLVAPLLGAALVGVVAPWDQARGRRVLVGVAGLAAVAVARSTTWFQASDLGEAGALGRVAQGLDPEVLLRESSIQWRLTELGAALESIARHPLTGVGLGVRYRDRLPGEVFQGENGLAYVHSLPVNVALKCGLVVLLLLLAGLIWLFARSRRLATRDGGVPWWPFVWGAVVAALVTVTVLSTESGAAVIGLGCGVLGAAVRAHASAPVGGSTREVRT